MDSFKNLNNVQNTNEYDDILSKINIEIDGVIRQIRETNDEIIFETLNRFAGNYCDIVVPKDELKYSIMLGRKLKDLRLDIADVLHKTHDYGAAYDMGYKKGYEDGKKSGREKLQKLMDDIYEGCDEDD